MLSYECGAAVFDQHDNSEFQVSDGGGLLIRSDDVGIKACTNGS